MQSSDQRNLWEPPQRPEWVQRINDEGECMDVSGVVPLDEKSLLDSAMRSTGLTDFGADDWREPFQVLIRSLEDEAQLNLMGRIRTRSELLQLLEARLQIEDTYKRHPEINDEQITQPFIVIGQGRSGTSFLTNVLAENPDNGALMQWEAMFPCPPPEKAAFKSDPRIVRSHKLIDQWNRVTPTIASMHEFSGYLPFECCEILALNFMSQTWCGGFGQVPNYDAYVITHNMTSTLQYHQRVLKMLQWKKPRRHWVLKDPMHLDRMALLLKIYPDACFVWTHRDPVRALASTISLIGTIQWGRCDHPFMNGSYEYLTDPTYSAMRFNAVIDQLDARVVPEKQIYHMLYKDIVGNTMSSLEDMYQHFDICLSESGRNAMSQYLAENPRDARPAHKFAMSPEAISTARKAYKRYQERFQIPSE